MMRAHLFAIVLFSLSSCGVVNENDSELKSTTLTTEQKLLDFDVAISNFKNYYAPLQYKEKTLAVKFEDVFAKLRIEAAQSKTDQDFYHVLGKLVDSFKDGHVSIDIPAQAQYELPFTVDLLDNHYVITNIETSFGSDIGLATGDELVSIDGKSVHEIKEELLKYKGLGYDRADQRYAAYQLTHRTYVPPTSMRTNLKFKRSSDGSEFTVTSYWKKKPNVLAPSLATSSFRSEVSNADILLFGKNTSFFYTDESREKFHFAKVSVSAEEWKKAGETGAPFDIFALLYRHQNKNILLIRIPTYSIADADMKRNLRTYELLLKSYSDLADVLVIDQTHNPGGSVEYVEELARLFIKRPGPSFAFAPRADSQWLRYFHGLLSGTIPPDARQYFENVYNEIDAANTRQDFLAPPIGLTRTSTTIVENTAWKKPILLLIDELCGSGGDGFPMILKGHNAATLFGHRTAGMGGNVEPVPALPNTGATIRLTRSLFYLATDDGTLPDVSIIENNGVSPHIQRDYGLKDFKEGFVSYVSDFSDAAVKL